MSYTEVIQSLPQDLVLSIGIILIFATLLAFLVKLFKQPLIPAYILAGLILGPLGIGIIRNIASIRIMSELGIAFLLFVVGLEMDVRKLKHVGLVASLGGLIQVILSFALGFIISMLLGFSQFESIILGLVLAFSSTMIVIKLLSDKENLDTLHGRIILGILIMQDILVVIALSLLNTATDINVIPILSAIAKGLILFGTAFIAGKYIFPKIFGIAARSRELLFLSSLAILFLFAIQAHFLSFSIAIGAFVAGLSLANLPYNIDVVGRVKPLKTFFATIFFVSLGMQLTTISPGLLQKAGILFLLIVLAKPILIFVIVSMFGYEKRTSFLTGLSLGQVSEFSLILIMTPLVLINISTEVFSIVILLAITTMILTSYFLEFQNGIYAVFSPLLRLTEKIFGNYKHKLEYKKKNIDYNFVLCGMHRMGTIIYKHLKDKKIYVIDNNPDTIRSLMKSRIPCLYGDIRNRDILSKLHFRKIKTMVSTVPNSEDNAFLIKYIKSKNKNINVLVTANHDYQARKLYELGADYVILPHTLGGEKVSSIIEKLTRKKGYLKDMAQRHKKRLLKSEF